MVNVSGEDVEVGLVEHDEDIGVAQIEVPLRLGLVVQAQDGRRRAPAQNPAARLQPGGEAREAEGAPFLFRPAGGARGSGLR